MRTIIVCLWIFFAQACLAAEPKSELAYLLKASVAKVHVGTKAGGHGVGTGVVVGKDLVATNCHILVNSTGVNITKFGETFAPVALRADWKHDLCILRFEYLDLKPVELGDSEQLSYGQEVFSIGFPGGPPKPQTTHGKIKALYTHDDSVVIRTDASFTMGASGSPVFDNSGKLVAISTFKSPGRGAYYYNMPVKWLKALLEAPETTSLLSDERPFWDALEENRPFFMRVILPYQNAQWDELDKIAALWVAKEPNSAEAHFYHGLAQEKLGNAQNAKAEFAKTLELHPLHTATLFELGLMAKQEGNQPELERLTLAIKAINAETLDEFNSTLNPQPESNE